jgi:hypothetical protein
MAKKSVVPKQRRGPVPTGKGTQVGERWHDKTLTRSIRRLVALGLKAKAK